MLERLPPVLPAQTYHFDDMVLESDVLDTDWGSPSRVALRIRQYRTAPLKLAVTDAAGAPVSVQQLSVRHVRHEFPLGTAIAPEYQPNEPWYLQTAATMFPGAMVSENLFKVRALAASTGAGSIA